MLGRVSFALCALSAAGQHVDAMAGVKFSPDTGRQNIALNDDLMNLPADTYPEDRDKDANMVNAARQKIIDGIHPVTGEALSKVTDKHNDFGAENPALSGLRSDEMPPADHQLVKVNAVIESDTELDATTKQTLEEKIIDGTDDAMARSNDQLVTTAAAVTGGNAQTLMDEASTALAAVRRSPGQQAPQSFLQATVAEVNNGRGGTTAGSTLTAEEKELLRSVEMERVFLTPGILLLFGGVTFICSLVFCCSVSPTNPHNMKAYDRVYAEDTDGEV